MLGFLDKNDTETVLRFWVYFLITLVHCYVSHHLILLTGRRV